jgi:mannosyltransferase
MQLEGVDRGQKHILWLLAGLIVLAITFRFWQLGDWNFQATEIFTLRDSATPQFRNPRPLGYLLTYYLVRPIMPLDEFGLRLLPAVFGVLAIPTMYLVGRRVVGSNAALFATVFLTFSPLHIMYSQLARYWSLVFLLCTIYPYVMYLGLRDRNPRTLVLGLITGVLAALAHPMSLLLIGGPVIGFLWPYVRPSSWRRMWSRREARWASLAVAPLVILILVRFLPMLQGWISQHDKHPGSSQFLLRYSPPGWKQIFFLAAYVDGLTFPLVLLAILGIYVLWREGQRPLALFMGSLALFPILFLTLLSLRTPVSQYYLLPTLPVFFLGAGLFLNRLSESCMRYPRWLTAGTLSLIVIAAGLPTLLSDLRDGRRYDLRGAAQWLRPRLAAGDVVFSDQAMVLAYYLPGAEIERLRRTEPLEDTLRRQQRAGQGALWIVAPAASHAFRPNLEENGLIDWIYGNCQLQNMMGVGRVDYRQQYLQVYRCPPSASGGERHLGV